MADPGLQEGRLSEGSSCSRVVQAPGGVAGEQCIVPRGRRRQQ